MKTMKVLPPRIFQLAILTVVVLHFLLPVYYLYNSPIRFLGLLPIIAGIYLNLHSDWLIKKYRTTVKPFEKPTKLIEKGPFSFSRNPMYLGMALIILGGSIISGSVLSFAVPIVFALIIHYKFIIIEEALLENSFGPAYLKYKSRVHCWI
jgi:protein-S-isoprenylcysteine O-methyltransferase Ste14